MDPVDLPGPHVATAAEDLEPGFHPARPQLTALDDGEVWLSYSMAGRRIRAVPSFDGGITWPESLGAVEDREVRGGGPSNVVGLDGGWGVAWEHFVFEGDSLFFTHVDRRGFPTGPPRLIGDNLGGEVRQIGYYAPGRWHTAWLASAPFGFDLNVYYSVSSDGVSWSSPIRVNPELDSAGVDVPESIAISTDADGHVYIAYEYGFGANAEAIHVMTTRQRAYDPADVPSALEASTAPNPFRLSTSLTLRSPSPGTADVRIFDAAGRLVREWRGVLLFGGVTTMTWDGRFTSGRSAPAGVYYWRATMETEAGRRRARAKAVYLGR